MGKEKEISRAEELTHGRREGRGTPAVKGGGGGEAKRSRNQKALLSELSLRGGAGVFPQMKQKKNVPKRNP